MKRTMLLVIFACVVLSFSACRATTIKKIYVEDEEFFEYPHIVESDKILIEDSPERFYSFIRNLKDYLYENETEKQFFVKKDDAIYMLDLLPIAIDETTVYELRIVEQSIAYGNPINQGGWINLVVEFPFPNYLLEGTPDSNPSDPQRIDVMYDELVRFYRHVANAAIDEEHGTILLEVAGGSIWFEDLDATSVHIEFISNLRVSETYSILHQVDFSEFVLDEALRMTDDSSVPPHYSLIVDHAAELTALVQPLFDAITSTGMLATSYQDYAAYRFKFSSVDSTLMVIFSEWNEGAGFVTFSYVGGDTSTVVATYRQDQFENEMSNMHAYIETNLTLSE